MQYVKDPQEKRALSSILDIIENNFGFNFNTMTGNVIEIQLISAGLALIPRQLNSFKKLYKVQLPSNKIRKLRNLDLCKEVSILNLSDNSIPTSELSLLSKNQTIISLDLSSNKITSFEDLKELKNLESLNLSDNLITEIPSIQFSKLKFLDLSSNPITEIKNLHLFESLIKVNLDNTKIPDEEKVMLNLSIEEIKEYCRNKFKSKSR